MRVSIVACCLMVATSCTQPSDGVGEGEGEPVGEGEGESPFDYTYCPTPPGNGGCETVEGGADCPLEFNTGMSGTPCFVPLIHCRWCNNQGAFTELQCGNELLIEPYVWEGQDDPSCFSEGM